MREKFQSLYRITCNQKLLGQLTEQELFIVLRQKQINKIEHKAAIFIQKYGRMFVCHRKYTAYNKLRNLSALRI